MIGTTVLAKVIPLWQTVSPDLRQAIQEEVQQELARGPFRFSGGAVGDELVGVFVPVAFFAMVVLIIFAIARQRQAEIRARAEFQKQILDKFSSGREFVEFLGTEGSQRFLQSLSASPFGARERVLRTMRGGITIAVVGIGFLLLAATRRGFVVPGVLLLALGVGLLISAAVSFQLLKKWTGGDLGVAGHPPVPPS